MSMIEHTIPSIAWGSRSDISPSANQFRMLVKRCLETAIEAQIPVQDSYAVFGQTQSIRPAECDQTLDSVHQLSVSIENLCELLAEPTSIPLSFAPFRFSLLISLYHVKDQIRSLVPIVSSFRYHCLEESRHTHREQSKIQRKLESLVRAGKSIEQEGMDLLDRALFQERRMAADHSKSLFTG